MYPTGRRATLEEDQQFARRSATLQWLEPRHLEMEEAAQQCCLNDVVLALSQRDLTALNRHATPEGKLGCLVRTYVTMPWVSLGGPG